MKTYLLLFLLLVCGSINAQQGKSSAAMVVKDSSGRIYGYEEWQAMLRNGDHVLKPEDPVDIQTAFFIVKLSDEYRDLRLSKLPRPKPSRFFSNGKKPGTFTATDMKGNTVNLEDLKGKVIVMNFWFMNCSPCRQEIPDLNKLVEKYRDNESVIFLAITPDHVAGLENFLLKIPFDYTIIPNGNDILMRYKVNSFPTHAILDKEGKIFFHTTGLAANTIYWVERSIKDLLSKEK
jgi:thiol-disulfide isomerase/thioredoxin